MISWETEWKAMAATRWKWLPLGQRPEQSLFSNPETNERGGRLPGGKTLQHQQVCNMDIPLIFPQRCQFQHIDMGGKGSRFLRAFGCTNPKCLGYLSLYHKSPNTLWLNVTIIIFISNFCGSGMWAVLQSCCLRRADSVLAW